jgi:serine-type D-Ala-D-Ala carboxypeptidase/endopeptidase (penicillin-binding protein 4)
VKHLFVILLASVSLFGCRTTQNLSQTPTPNALIDSSEVMKNSFVGMAIYDLKNKEMLFERNADRYFTPASNTKLFTLFASLKTLGDSIPSLRYVVRGDSLIFWGTGDPTNLHPDFQNEAAIKFLKSRKEKLFYSDANFTMGRFGPGWSWDDYADYYSPELSGLPLYGNILRFTIKNKLPSVNPLIFKSSFSKTTSGSELIERTEFDNQFSVSEKILGQENFSQDIPFKTSTALTQQFLMDTLKKNINLIKTPISGNIQTVYGMKTDTVLRKMMRESDNFLAEHLMVLVGSKLKDSLNIPFAISTIKEQHLNTLPDAPKWADGSGLSRYNLFTPRSMVKLCELIAETRPLPEVYSYMSVGGQSGTLKGQYKAEKPYVFAKTGTLGGVFCLSGFLETKSGKTLVFSVMQNNFTHGASKIRKETERILKWVHETY